MEHREPTHYETFLNWMYPNKVQTELLGQLPVDVLIEVIESQETQHDGHQWAVRYLNGEGVEKITKDIKAEKNTGKVYMAIGSLARKLAEELGYPPVPPANNT